MNEHTVVLLLCLAVIGVLAALLYAAIRGQVCAFTGLCEVRQTLQQILTNTQNLQRTMREQRSVLNDAHKKITAVLKGFVKPAG